MDMSQVSVGMRFKVHPATDLFMMGFRYGTVVKVGRKWVHAEVDCLDVTRRVKLSPGNMLPIE